MKRTFFFCDIDGTLLRGAMVVPERVKEAARRYAVAGGGLVLCTGRSPKSTLQIARDMDVALPCIVHSGAMIYDFTRCRAVRTMPMPVAARDVLETLMSGNSAISVQACTDDKTYLLRGNAVLSSRGVREDLARRESSLDEVRGDILKIVLTCEDTELLRSCGETLFDQNVFAFAFASTHFAEVVARGADKGAAAHSLAEELGVAMEDTFAAGDAMTDFPLLRSCGYTFAPEDSARPLLEICDTIIPTCENSGMETAFQAARNKASAYGAMLAGGPPAP